MSGWRDSLDPISSPAELYTLSLLQRLNGLFFLILDSGQYNFGGKETFLCQYLKQWPAEQRPGT